MKKGLVFLLFLMLTITALAAIEDLVAKIPSIASNVILVEDLKGNYEKLKGTVLGDVLLNQLALEQIVAQYIEMAAYNNGQDPQTIYNALSGNLVAARWNSGNETNDILILGPIEEADSAKKAIETVLPQFLPENVTFNIATDGKYLYIGNVEEYSRVKKGYPIFELTKGLPGGFLYLVGDNEDFLHRGVLRFENGYLIGEGILTAKTEEAAEKLSAFFKNVSVEDMETSPRFSFVILSLKANSLADIESIFKDQLSLSIPAETIPTLSKEFLDKISHRLTGELMVDMDLDVDQLLNTLMNLQQGDIIENNATITSQQPIKLISRIGFDGSFDDLLSLMKEGGIEYTVEGNVAKTTQNMYIWVEDGYLVSSLANRAETNGWLQNMKPLTDNPLFTQLSQGMPDSHLFSLFIDAGAVLSVLMGTEIESGIAAFSWYSSDDKALKGKFVLK
ncbi:hypothetical protein [Kosmotoga pacifica]|uniref:DUF3352 domain-containing protein n=1 Tax=Kosmotoga pacifica TaxID=1330330 RepID=A0A0G2ZAU7_9BACT|nr:hypothetical protein [Kosmotoga pacifica]AKI97221.1 hypothetical protein IX53_04665 [Kosmotoga pacifica]